MNIDVIKMITKIDKINNKLVFLIVFCMVNIVLFIGEILIGINIELVKFPLS